MRVVTHASGGISILPLAKDRRDDTCRRREIEVCLHVVGDASRRRRSVALEDLLDRLLDLVFRCQRWPLEDVGEILFLHTQPY